MSVNAGEKLQAKINFYKKVMQEQQEKIQQAKKELDTHQEEIQEKIVKIVTNRSISTKERTEQMVPLMEKQDLLKDFMEEIETLVEKEN